MFSNERIENTYTIKGNLGSGSYGSVFIVEKKDSNESYAMKRINTSQLLHVNDYRRQMHEMNILFFNQCHYLLHGSDVSYIREKSRLDIVTELYHGGNLNNFILKHRAVQKRISNEVIWNIFIQICLGIQYLHGNGVIHRDLKPANILLNNKDMPTKIALCDFGASICLENENAYCYTKIGTPYFMSPEQNNSDHYDKKTDIWSLGCILYELITLEKPFEANNINMLNQKINKGYYKPLLLKSNYSDTHIWSYILKKMLEPDVNIRSSIDAILDLPEIREKIVNHKLIQTNGIKLDIPERLNSKIVHSSYGLYNYIVNLKNDFSSIILKPKSSYSVKEIIVEKINKNNIKLPPIEYKNLLDNRLPNKPNIPRIYNIIRRNRYILGFYDPKTNKELAFDNVGLKSWKESVADLPDYNSPK
jgi:serine/threonine protein kinase